MKNLPEIFEQCLVALYSKYLLYADYYQTTGRLPLHSEDEDEITPEKLLELSHTSNFHLLAHDSESEEIQFPLPLIVNTDGLIRGIGVEIQRIILQTVKPTHILHLQNEKDKILAPIEEMREQHQQQLQKHSEENVDGTENRLKKLQISLLTPGRTTASRLSAQDLRDLR
jgi:polynucleotide 5'-kinase involved in rRNA processing